jgi:serine/threonine-protein kinase
MTPRQVGNYRVDHLLGAGGMGEVYRAYDTRRDRYVALKLLPEAFSDDQEYLQRFQRESHVAARLREPHVIPIHDFGEIDGQLFIDMRLVDGADIGALLDEQGPIAPPRAVYLISQAAEALDAAHADRLVHRDIKPSNILVTTNDFVYVVDFGIARSMGGHQTALTITGATIGTLHYMAPERFAGQDVDGRADVYSLACVLHECLTGVPPFSGKDLPALIYAQLYSGPPQASGLVAGVSPAMDAVIARGMAKDPNDRFPTAGALAAAAREAALTEAPVPPPLTEPEAPLWTEMPATTSQAATTASAPWQAAERPPDLEPEPAGGLSARGSLVSQMDTVSAFGIGDLADARPPEDPPPGTGPDPDGGGAAGGEETGRHERGPGWRRLRVLLPAAAAVVAVAVAVVFIASPKTKTGGTAPPANAAGATTAGTAASSGSARSVAPGLAVPTVAEKIAVGQNPSYVQVAPNGKFAYIANSGGHVINVLNTANDQVTGTVKIPQGPPQFISFSADSTTAYVSVYEGRKTAPLVAFINTATGQVTGTVPVNNVTPGPTTVSPDGRYLYVPNHNMVMGGTGDNLIDVIDTVSKKLVDTIPVDANPHWIVFGKNPNDGVFYATNHMSTVVTVVKASTNKAVKTIEVGETPHSIAISPDGSRLAITSFNGNEVFVVSTATDNEVATVKVGRNPLEVAYSPDGRYIFTANNEDNTVTVIDAAGNRAIAEIPTGKAPTSISVLPDGHQAYVTDENDGTVEVLNIPQ